VWTPNGGFQDADFAHAAGIERILAN